MGWLKSMQNPQVLERIFFFHDLATIIKKRVIVIPTQENKNIRKNERMIKKDIC